MRAALASAVLALLAGATLAGSGSAHQAAPDPITGTFELAPGQVFALDVVSFHPHDDLRVDWTTQGGLVATSLTYATASGESHVGSTVAPGGATFLRYRAPDDLATARVEWTVSGDKPATVTYAYLSSADFWRTPALFLPAAIPFFLLAGAVLAAWLARPWMKRLGTGPVRPPGWEEAQQAKADGRLKSARKTHVPLEARKL